MKLQLRQYLLIVIVFAFLSSCTDTTPPNVESISKEKLMNTSVPGFQWFEAVYHEYTPDTLTIESIKSIFNPINDKFVLFGKPGCSCDDEAAESLAKLVKVLDEAGIMEDNYELYTISSVDSKHKYEDVYDVNIIPSYFLLKNEIAIYSLYDTVSVDIANEKTINIEEYVLKALESK